MAWTDFYMQTTGSNLNSGSTNADAASITQTNGSWDITANTFIAASGLPFAAVNVGDWVSIYNDGAFVTPFVAQVTAVNDLGLSVTVSATVKFGTKPAAGATGKSCKVGGAWASLGMLASGCALNTGTAPLATRVNIKAGTYANTTTSRTFGLAGTTLLPVWYRGYKTTIGDMDAVPETTLVAGTDIPSITFGDATLSMDGAHSYFSSLDVVGARSGSWQVITNGTQIRLVRVRIENTSSNVNSYAAYINGSGGNLVGCWIKAHTSALVSLQLGGAGSIAMGCAVRGGTSAVAIGSSCSLFRSVVISASSDGISIATSGAVHVIGNTIYAPGRDGVRWTGSIPTSNTHTIADNIFTLCGGYDLNNASGTNTNFINRHFNCSYSPTSGHANGFGDSVECGLQTDSSQTVTSSTDMTPVSGSNANNNALPGGLFENESFSNFGAIGAVQPAAGAGGGLFLPRGFTGGFSA